MLAGLLEVGHELAAAVDLDGLDRKRRLLDQVVEEPLGGGCGGVAGGQGGGPSRGAIDRYSVARDTPTASAASRDVRPADMARRHCRTTLTRSLIVASGGRCRTCMGDLLSLGCG